jgi:lysozyme
MGWVLVRQGVTYIMEGSDCTSSIPTGKTQEGDLIIKLPSGVNIVVNDNAPIPKQKMTQKLDAKSISLGAITKEQAKEQAIALVVEFCKLTEAFEADAYEDPINADGLPITAGYGSTRNRDGNPFRLGDRLTQNEADHLLWRDVEEFYQRLTDTPYWDVMVPGQQAALTSLAYNKGTGNQDSLNVALKNKHWNDVGEILQKYDNKDQLGLSRRRYAEWLLWRGATPKNAYEKAWRMSSVASINKAVVG